MNRKAILSAPGSRGDVNPMVAIGAALRARGFEVVISLAEPYADVAEAAGLIAEPVISRARFDDLLSDANVWKPIRGARAILREVAGEFLALHLNVIAKHHVPGNTILVSHPLDLASRIHRDADATTPLVDVHLAPSMLRTFEDPSRMTPWPIEVSRPRWLVESAYRILDAVAVDPIIAPQVNAARRSMGLEPVRRIIHDWWLSPDRVLAMYPDWYAPATSQFSPRLSHIGFPLHDAATDDLFVPPTDRPIVFTAGTAHHHCRSFFDAAAKACQTLRRPGLLVSTHAENFPAWLPDGVTTSTYVSFAELLPHCEAIVHHGGIGTTSQAFAAGIPQIIRPMAFDQFDNATRVQRLNCGVWLRRDRDLANCLARVLADDAINRSCKLVQAQTHVGAAERAAEAVETLFSLTMK